MGDPFLGLHYDKGSILIIFFGGSRERWGFELRFRYQNQEWFLRGKRKLVKLKDFVASNIETLEY